MFYTHLGVEITSKCNNYEEVRRLGMKVESILEYLEDEWMHGSTNILKQRENQRPAMTYARETRADTTRTKQILKEQRCTL